jgi:hypothetical protein
MAQYNSLMNQTNGVMDTITVFETIDFSDAQLLGFPVDNTTIQVNPDGVLEVMDDSITNAKIAGTDLEARLILDELNITNLQDKTNNQTRSGTVTTFTGSLAVPVVTLNGVDLDTRLDNDETDISNLQNKTANQSRSGTVTTFTGSIAVPVLTLNGTDLNTRLTTDETNISTALSRTNNLTSSGTTSTFTGSLTCGPLISGNTLPSIDNTYDNGSATFRWKDVRGMNGNFATEVRTPLLVLNGANIANQILGLQDKTTYMSVIAGETVINSNLRNFGATTYDLGVPTTRWKQLYIQGIDCSGNANVADLACYGINATSITNSGSMSAGSTSVSSLTNSGTMSAGSTSVSSLTSSGTMSCGSQSFTCGALNSTSVTNSGTMSSGATSVGSLLSSGTMSCGSQSFTCGAANVTSMTSSGSISCGTQSATVGALTCRAIDAGTHGITSGAITSSGTFSCGANAATVGALSSTSITASGTFSCGSNAATCGALTATTITASTSIETPFLNRASNYELRWNNIAEATIRTGAIFIHNKLCIGTNTATIAGLYCTSYVANVADEASCIRASSAEKNTKIEIANTASGGKLWELGASSSAYSSGFYFNNRTDGVTYWWCLPTGSKVHRVTNLSTWDVTSDADVKENIEDYDKGLSAILALKPKLFDYREDADERLPKRRRQRKYSGLIAQDVMSVFPECVSRGDNGLLNMNYDDIHIASINAIKDLNNELNIVKNKISKLEEQINIIT